MSWFYSSLKFTAARQTPYLPACLQVEVVGIKTMAFLLSRACVSLIKCLPG